MLKIGLKFQYFHLLPCNRSFLADCRQLRNLNPQFLSFFEKNDSGKGIYILTLNDYEVGHVSQNHSGCQQAKRRGLVLNQRSNDENVSVYVFECLKTVLHF